MKAFDARTFDSVISLTAAFIVVFLPKIPNIVIVVIVVDVNDIVGIVVVAPEAASLTRLLM